MSSFHPASRKGTYVLIGLTGHSSSGKTYSALLLARGLVGEKGKIAFIDTENGRGSMYSNLTKYDVVELNAPFTSERYAELVREAADDGYDALIIDSFSHEHEGSGGYLEFAEEQKDSGGRPLKGLQKWLRPKVRRKKLVNAILQSRMHIIVCMRGKDKLVQMKNEQGKEVIVNTGVVPIQDPRFLYEMTVSFIMDENKMPKLHKCPEDLRAAFPADKHLSIQSGKAIADWVGTGEVVSIDAAKLKDEARKKAEGGTDAFRAYWKTLDQAKCDILRPMLNELQHDATEVDKAQAPPPPQDDAVDDGLDTRDIM